MTPPRLYVDGAWCDGTGGRVDPVHDPATEAVIARVAYAAEVDVDRAVRAAHLAFPAWRAWGTERRCQVLRRTASLIAERAEPMAHALTAEQGKTLTESRAELARAAETFAWHADAAPAVCAPRLVGGGDTVVRPEPLGIVAAFAPWNYPAVIIARKLAAALAAGCTVVLKAAEETPTIAVMLVDALAQALADADAPRGVVNLLFGDPPAISNRLLMSPSVRVLSFTGSTAVGKQLAARAGATLTRCILELGGHAAAIVFDDANVDDAARAIAAYKFECAGQSCNAPSRIYVQQSVYDRFVDALVEAARAVRVGDGRDPSSDMGPMANPRRLTAMERLTADARSRGARVLTGGARLARRGWFWPPTVFVDVAADAALTIEEPFGPLAPVWPFDSAEEVLRRANANPYGLAAYVFTTDAERAAGAASALEVGSVGINVLRGVSPDTGVAGVKDSGYGYEGGVPGMEAFLSLKVVRGMSRDVAHEQRAMARAAHADTGGAVS